jgi:hypothetical protein
MNRASPRPATTVGAQAIAKGDSDVDFDPRSFVSKEHPSTLVHYALLIYRDDSRWSALSAEERDRIWDDAQRVVEEAQATGQYVAGAALHGPSTATTLRRNSEQRTVMTDGPFAETKEVLAGFLLADCATLDAALKLAARVPILRFGGSVEVRPVGVRCE